MAYSKPIRDKNGDISVYEIRVYRGVDANGKQLPRLTKRWKVPPNMSPSKVAKELKKAEIEFENECKSGFDLNNGYTFAKYADYVVDLKQRSGVKHSVIVRYHKMLVRINKAIGHLKLSEITPPILNRFYKDISKNGMRENKRKAVCRIDLKEWLTAEGLTIAELNRRSGVSTTAIHSCIKNLPVEYETAEKICSALNKSVNSLFDVIVDNTPLSSKTIREHHRIISAVLNQAVREMLVTYNAAERATPPKVETPEPNYFQPEQVEAIREALEDEPLVRKVMVHLLLIAGVRRGELVGLCWSCVDWEKSRIHICRNVQYKEDVGVYISTPKTKKSDRYISLPAETMDLLRAYYIYWKDKKSRYGSAWKPYIELPNEETIARAEKGQIPEKQTYKSDFLFVQEKIERAGYPCDPDSVTAWLRKFSKRRGLPHLNPHAFRHTMASLLYYGGVDPVSISSRLGHAQISTTVNTRYGHTLSKQPIFDITQDASERTGASFLLVIIFNRNNCKLCSIPELKQLIRFYV